MGSIVRMTRLLATVGLTCAGVHAAEIPLSNTLSAEQAQARQAGIFVGGTASEYDLCVKKGFLKNSGSSAEAVAQSILDKMRTLNGPDQFGYVQEGWDMMKKEIDAHESFYTPEKCAAVGKQWVKMMASRKD